jgi:hypothetical protein
MRAVAVVSIGVGIVLAGACGGEAFSAGGGDDAASEAGDDAAAVPGPDSSHPVDSTVPPDVVHDVVTSDGITLPDALEEPPPTCSGAFACVPPAPPSWNGPLELYAGAAGTPPACSMHFVDAYDGVGELNAPPATCGCSCGSPTVTCTAGGLTLYDGACTSTTPCDMVPLADGACVEVNANGKCSFTTLSAILSAPQVASASCAAQGSKTVPPAAWGLQARACASSVALEKLDCTGGAVCAPQPQSPFEAKVCVAATGQQACPSGPYSVQHVFYGGVDDTRDCSACTCPAPANASCASSAVAYISSDGSCSGMTTTVASGCGQLLTPKDVRLTVTPSSGGCGSGQSAPTGTADPTQPTTFCCLP